MEQTDAATLTSTLKDALIRSGLQLTQCRGQTYDGASNMSGKLAQIGSESHCEASTKALGFLALMEKFATYYGLKLFMSQRRTTSGNSTMKF